MPLGYPIGRQLASRRVGLILAALLAFNPMLIWYSQEARSYALLVFFGALSFFFFVRALDTGRGRDLALWALASALALCSHYFACLRRRDRGGLAAVALRAPLDASCCRRSPRSAPRALALLPLIAAQTNPNHIGWIEESPLPERFWETGVSFLIGETGHVIAEPPREPLRACCPRSSSAAGLLLLALGDTAASGGAGRSR